MTNHCWSYVKTRGLSVRNPFLVNSDQLFQQLYQLVAVKGGKSCTGGCPVHALHVLVWPEKSDFIIKTPKSFHALEQLYGLKNHIKDDQKERKCAQWSVWSCSVEYDTCHQHSKCVRKKIAQVCHFTVYYSRIFMKLMD